MKQNLLELKECIPCQKGAPAISAERITQLLQEIDSDWNINLNKHLVRKFTFKNFVEALDFVNKVGEIAEAQNHHPNIYVENYKEVRLELFTHKINSLHENDFILAAKIDRLTA